MFGQARGFTARDPTHRVPKLLNYAVMEYKHSALNFRYPIFADVEPYPNPDMDAHLQEWADAGYELVTATQRSRDGGSHAETTFTFIWRRPRQTATRAIP